MITLRADQLHDVRACLFYLSIFPLDYHIRCSTLMRLWMAERFAIQENGGGDQAIAEGKLRNLLDRNFFQEMEKTSYGTARTCRVHNLQREIIMKKSKDDEFAMIFANPIEEWPENIWRLSFHSSLHNSASANVSSETFTRVQRLRSLLVFQEVYLEYIEKLLEQVHRLKVLHLEASSLKSFPKGIPRLKYLRYLKLSGTGVETIPEDIGHLAYLETLDLKGTSVVDLPDGILKLKKLRHLLVYKSCISPDAIDPKVGVKAPSALGDLISLQKLCMIELNPVKVNAKWGKPWKIEQKRRKPWNREQLLGELGKLTSLQRLGISELRSVDAGFLCSSIKRLTNLEALHLIVAGEEMIDLPEVHTRKAPACLQRVHLTGCFGNFSNWLLSSSSLVKLVLTRSPLNVDALQQLRELRGLKHLELQQVYDVDEMTFQAGGFPELRFLGLNKIYSLSSLVVDQGALRTLETLSLTQCQSLKTVPQDITRCGKLTCLELFDMPEEFKIAVVRHVALKQITVKLKRWNHGAIEVAIMLPERPAGRPVDPRSSLK